MLLTHGDVSKLAGKNWYYVELATEHCFEAAFRRIITQVPGIFGQTPVEIFLPISNRSNCEAELSTANFIFVRSTELKLLVRLRKIMAIYGLQTWGESKRVADAISIKDADVQPLIAAARNTFEAWSKNITTGSFVRVIDGEARDLCGTVIHIRAVATVKVELKTKILIVETPVSNLINLGHVPANKRVFYYSDLVAELEDAELVRPDLHFVASKEEPVESAVPKPRSRTLSSLVRRLVSEKATPAAIREAVVEAVENRTLYKNPCDLVTLACICRGIIFKEKIDMPRGFFGVKALGELLPHFPVVNQRRLRDGRSKRYASKKITRPIEHSNYSGRLKALTRSLIRKGLNVEQVIDKAVEAIKSGSLSEMPKSIRAVNLSMRNEFRTAKMEVSENLLQRMRLHELLPDLPFDNPGPKFYRRKRKAA